MHADEREVLIDLIGSVRTLAKHTLTLHLQLGAIRTLLERQGVITDSELNAVLTELGAITAIDEFTRPSAPSPDAVFDEMLRRLGEAA